MSNAVKSKKKLKLLRIGVLADDLTGAGDVGGCFAKAGLKTVIALPLHGTDLQPNLEPGTSSQPEIFVIDTESRYEAPFTAQARVKAAFGALSLWGANFFYKKIDSTLRGNVGPEMDAFLEAMLVWQSNVISKGQVRKAVSSIPVVAAYPAAGRRTREGWQWVEGARLGDVHQAHVPTLLKETCCSWPFFGVEDCFQHSDMMRLALNVLREFSKSGLSACVASAGLACAMAQLLSRGTQEGGEVSETLSSRLPTIIVCGSKHPSSIAQVDKFLELSKRNNFVIEGPAEPDVDLQDVIRSLSENRRGPTVVLRVTPRPERPQAVTGWLAYTTGRLLRALGPGQLVLMGGDTAFRVCDGLGVRRLAIRGMEGPGIAVCEPMGPEAGTAPKIVLKPGGFGSPSTLIDILKN